MQAIVLVPPEVHNLLQDQENKTPQHQLLVPNLQANTRLEYKKQAWKMEPKAAGKYIKHWKEIIGHCPPTHCKLKMTKKEINKLIQEQCHVRWAVYEI